MVSKSMATSMLVLRIVALTASTVTVVLLVTNNVNFDDGTMLKLIKDVISSRYVLAVAVIAAAYSIVQLPFALYYAVKQKRLLDNGFLGEFDFYGDKVISLLLATGIGAGFGVSFEFKKFFNDFFDEAAVPKNDPTRSTFDKFFVRGIIVSAVLSVAFISMAVVSIISSINRSRSKGMFR